MRFIQSTFLVISIGIIFSSRGFGGTDTEAGAPCLNCLAGQPAAPAPLTPLYADSGFGVCPSDASSSLGSTNWFKRVISGKTPWEKLQDSWSEYNRLMNIRVGANAKIVNDKLHLGKSPVVFLAGI